MKLRTGKFRRLSSAELRRLNYLDRFDYLAGTTGELVRIAGQSRLKSESLLSASAKAIRNSPRRRRPDFFSSSIQESPQHEMLSAALDAAIVMAQAHFGNIQLVDPKSGALRIKEQSGFSEPFLRFFDTVSTNESACGSALVDRRQVFIEDVQSHPIFAGTRGARIMFDAEANAVVSTPIIAADHVMLGMVSVHYRQLRSPERVPLTTLNVIAVRLAELLSASAILGVKPGLA